MVSIDEAIEREKNLAGFYKHQYLCDCNLYGKNFIDNNKLTCVSLLEEHEQLAEWLEELKANKATSAEVYEQGYKRGYKNGYNKAIDDFAEKLKAKCDGIIKDKWNSNVAPVSWEEAYADFKDDIDEIAEQLKAGGTSGTDNQ